MSHETPEEREEPNQPPKSEPGESPFTALKTEEYVAHDEPDTERGEAHDG